MSKYTALTSRVEKKRQAENDLKNLMQDKSNVTVKLGSERANIIEIRQALTSYQGSVERDKGRGKVSPYEERLHATENDYRRCNEIITNLEKRQLEIADEKLRLEQLIQECDSGADVAEVKAHHSALANAQAEVEQIRTLIAEQEEALANATSDADERLESLQERRETVLAGIVLGESQQSDLDELDKAIADILEDADGSQRKSLEQYRHASQTINGLRQRLTEAEAALAELDGLTDEVLEQFLIGQAAELSAAYTAQAQVLGEQFARLKALDEILMDKTGRKNMTFIPANWWQLYIPGLPGFSVAGTVDGAVFKADVHNYPAQVQIEIERLRGIGLDAFF